MRPEPFERSSAASRPRQGRAGRRRVERSASFDLLLLQELLHERNATGELVVHERPGLVLDLVELRDLLGRQHLLEARQVRGQDRDVVALEAQVLLQQARGLRVGHRLVRRGVVIEELQQAIVVRDHVALVRVVDGPEHLGLALRELEHLGHHGLLVGPELLAQDVHVVGGLVLRDDDPAHETGQGASQRDQVRESISHGRLAPFVRRGTTRHLTPTRLLAPWDHRPAAGVRPCPADYSPRSVGSRRSRSQSPVRLTTIDVSMSTMPGAVEIHQAESRYSRPSCTMPPHDGVGGWTPRPRNDSVASSTMARASSSVAMTTSEESTLGSTCRAMTRTTEPPRAWMASTNSRERSTSTCERSTRAYVTQPESPMTTIRVGKLGPSTAMMPIASRMNGNASWASASVMIMLSVQPPRKPATSPRVAPTSPPTMTAAKPTSKDTRAP